MNHYNPNKHHRRSIRLKGYDYSQPGQYFVTICVQNRISLFGHVSDQKMHLNNAGKMVETEWLKLADRFTNIKLHEFVVMPNHFHAILEIVDHNNEKGKGQPQGIAPTGIAPTGIAPTGIAPTGIEPTNQVRAALVVAQNIEKGKRQTEKGKGGQQGIAPTGMESKGMESKGMESKGMESKGMESKGMESTNQGIGSAKTLGDMVGAFQSIVTVKYIRGVKNRNWPPFYRKLWQRNYWEHIIRNEGAYQRIAQYIINNPKKWEDDKLNNGKGNKVL